MTLPLQANAQQPVAVSVIGVLHSASPHPYVKRMRAFQRGLSEAGFVEGQNLKIEYRWAEGNYDRLLGMRRTWFAATCR